MFKESDESVVERWTENAYWQYFTGEELFQTRQPFDPSEFVHFRKRLKEEGLAFLLSQSVSLHPKAKNEKEVQIDTTVQEKNITFPTDAKPAKKVIGHCIKITEKEGVKQDKPIKESANSTLGMLILVIIPSEKKAVARKKLRTIGLGVVRELEGKLPGHLQKRYETEFTNSKKVLT